MQPYTLIAEVACNHKGDLGVAKEFVDVAASFCQITHIKFQKRTVRELLSPEEYRMPHPVPYHAYGRTYGEHREALEFTIAQHGELKAYCESRGLIYACSAWDLTALKELLSLQPSFIKIPSAVNTNLDLLEYACRHFAGPIHISLGMTTRAEERAIVETCRSLGRLKDVVLYACTSAYPVEAADVCLLEIARLRADCGGHVRAVGFSGHHNGISLDIAAATLGATYLERHFTLNRTWKGTDHAASLEPDGMRRLNRNLQQLAQALTHKPHDVLPVEEGYRAKLKWRRKPTVTEPAVELA